jgi:cytochrome c oxidase accessory protein FixG
MPLHSPHRDQDPELDDGGLATLEKDGSRRWLYPRLSPGRFLRYRRLVAWVLIAFYALVPYVKIGGKPLILLDVVHREFTILGHTFLPTDTLLLAILGVAAFVAIFLSTALFGRIWCGWACPQTVWLEFLYRPIERLFDGTRGHGGKPRPTVGAWRTPAKYAAYLLVSVFITHTFLAYFVGVDALASWVTGSPADHPVAFMVMAVSTVLWMLNFCYFREQTCLVACPYGRFQSVMVDRQSLVISYDEKRGEPRGKLIRNPTPADPPRGDCIGCNLCVITCPTGIDIRKGLQMECIGCAQCIDACDTVMTKIDKPKGLIRYSSQAALDGEPVKVMRPRIWLYPILLTGLLVAFAWLFATKGTADVNILRNLGAPYVQLQDGAIGNGFRLKVHNRSADAQQYTMSLKDLQHAHLRSEALPLALAPGETAMVSFFIAMPAEAFADGPVQAILIVEDTAGFRREIACRLLGPVSHSAANSPASTPSPETPHDQP